MKKRNAFRVSLLGGLIAGTLAAAPGIGNAAAGEPQVTRSGSTVTITAGSIARNDNLTVLAVSGEFAVQGSGVRAGKGCVQTRNDEVRCGTGVTTISANLGAGDDRFSSLLEIGGTVDGGAGNDTFLAGRTLRGTALTYRGGTGNDRVDYSSSGSAVTVTKGVSSQPDGRPGIDRDDVSNDVETIRGTIRNDTLIGSSGADILIGDAGADTLRGNGGNDTLDARDPQGTKDTVIDCGAGSDTALVDAADAPVNCESISRP